MQRLGAGRVGFGNVSDFKSIYKCGHDGQTLGAGIIPWQEGYEFGIRPWNPTGAMNISR
jgi:hypothetical protein